MVLFAPYCSFFFPSSLPHRGHGGRLLFSFCPTSQTHPFLTESIHRNTHTHTFHSISIPIRKRRGEDIEKKTRKLPTMTPSLTHCPEHGKNDDEDEYIYSSVSESSNSVYGDDEDDDDDDDDDEDDEEYIPEDPVVEDIDICLQGIPNRQSELHVGGPSTWIRSRSGRCDDAGAGYGWEETRNGEVEAVSGSGSGHPRGGDGPFESDLAARDYLRSHPCRRSGFGHLRKYEWQGKSQDEGTATGNDKGNKKRKGKGKGKQRKRQAQAQDEPEPELDVHLTPALPPSAQERNAATNPIPKGKGKGKGEGKRKRNQEHHVFPSPSQPQTQTQTQYQSLESQPQSTPQNTSSIKCLYAQNCGINQGADPHHRKVVSHVFGRNKTVTRSVPEQIWIHFCRRHYQRVRYRMGNGNNGRGWAVYQCELLVAQLEKMEEWGRVEGFGVGLRRREVGRIQGQETGGNSEGRVGEERGISVKKGKGKQSQKTGAGGKQKQVRPAVASPVPGWLRDWVMRHEGRVLSFGEVRGLVVRIQRYIEGLELRADEEIRFPDIEILPVLGDCALSSSASSAESSSALGSSSQSRSEHESGSSVSGLGPAPHLRLVPSPSQPGPAEADTHEDVSATNAGNGFPLGSFPGSGASARCRPRSSSPDIESDKHSKRLRVSKAVRHDR
ncbi:hypothetical protein BJX61DRAFT_184957 [Aspergillus egyptiacus]|nr:hypothetical protein BJX61DRAFT_184957 [Aspergillus egyptiacus]